MVKRWSNDGRNASAGGVQERCRFLLAKQNPDVLWASGSSLIAFGQKLSIVKLSSYISVLRFPFSVFRFPFSFHPFGVLLFGWPDQGFRCASPLPVVSSPLRGFRSPFSVLCSQFSVLSSQFFTLITRRIPMSADSFEPNAKWRAVLRR